MINKMYLGDSVYASIDEFGNLILTTEDGYDITNTIVFESYTLVALNNYIREFKMRQNVGSNGDNTHMN